MLPRSTGSTPKGKTRKRGAGSLAAAAGLLLGAAVATPAAALPVIELELDGEVVNNTPSTAQIIGAVSFTPNGDPNVFGNLPTATVLGIGGDADVDFYQFTTTGGTAYFDIDNVPFTFDTILSLFDSMMTLIAYDDDTDSDPGSDSTLDSFLGAIILSQGTYYLAVTQFANFPNQALVTNGSALTRPGGGFGGVAVIGAAPGDASFSTSGAQAGLDYVLQISVNGPTPVAEPATLALLGAGLAGLGLARRRRGLA